MDFYKPEGLKALALYLDELITAEVIGQNELAKKAGVASSTLTNLRENRSNFLYIKPDIILKIASHLPDPRIAQIPGQPPRTFANPEDLLLMARGIIPLKKPQRQAESSLSLWLKNQMIERGLSPAQLAELLELPEQRIHELFNGQPPTPSECIFIAEILADSDTALIFQIAGADINAPIRTHCNGNC